MAPAIAIGVVIATGRVYGGRLAQMALTGYVELIRGTPILLQLFVLYYGLAAAITLARAEVQGAPRSAESWGHLGAVLLAHQFDREAALCFARAEQLVLELGVIPLIVERKQAVPRDCLGALYDLSFEGPEIRLATAETLLGAE